MKKASTSRVSEDVFFCCFSFSFLAVLGHCCCPRAFSGCPEQGLLSLCSEPASLVAEALGYPGFSSYGARAQLPFGMWDLPGAGKEPVSPVLAGGLPTPQSEKSQKILAYGSTALSLGIQGLPHPHGLSLATPGP